MPRIPRLLLRGESATFHVISRTALEGFVLGALEKDFLLALSAGTRTLDPERPQPMGHDAAPCVDDHQIEPSSLEISPP